MKITFLGTRGFINVKNRRHKRHTSTLFEYNDKRVMVDCGEDWLGKVACINPDAVVITHPHPDHAWGLKEHVVCPVYATPGMWRYMPFLVDAKIIKRRSPMSIAGLVFEAFPVIHSIKVPSVGYRISAGNVSVFCVHDLIAIRTPKFALAGVQLYIGDGSTITRPIVRRRGLKLFGHTTIRAQLGWCQKYSVPQAIFTHCGTQIVAGDERTLSAEIDHLGKERGVDASLAHDGRIVEIG